MRALLAALLVLSSSARAAESPVPADAAPTYDVLYDIRLVPGEGMARVTIVLGPVAGKLDWLRVRSEADRHFGFSGDGKIEIAPEGVRWTPPPAGGSLSYGVRIDRLRNERAYEARIAKSWAIFRGDDLVPPVRSSTQHGARARARLRVRLPEGWSVATPYPKNPDGTFGVDFPDRRFDRPVGWFVAGRIGVARETLAGTKISIAGPRGHGLRRLDQLLLLRLALPQLKAALGVLPERILIVGAGDPMWRGGLSGPASLFLHGDRPLIGSDTTSPLIHELVHVAMRARSGPDGDWISEGLAEYYAIDILARARAIGRKRFERAMTRLEERGRKAPRLLMRQVQGDATARAVGVMRALDAELRAATSGTRGIDDVARRLVAEPKTLTTARFVRLASEIAGRDLAPFLRRQIGEDWAPEAASP
jgi:hypothetical protein